jgi:hypothetical protein
MYKMNEFNNVVYEITETTYDFDLNFKNWVKINESKTEISPEQNGLKKSAILDIILIKEVNDENVPSGKRTLIYDRKVKVSVRNTQENKWCYLLFSEHDKRLYVKILDKTFTYLFNLGNDAQVSMKTVSEKRISEETAKKINSGYVMSKFEQLENGETDYGRFVKPSQ